MPKKENIDLTDELVREVEATAEETAVMEEPTRGLAELIDVAYEDMTEDERKYLISALKMKATELDEITKRAFEENRKIREAASTNLRLMEDTLTFIKTSIGNCYGAVNLSIKNIEREVK